MEREILGNAGSNGGGGPPVARRGAGGAARGAPRIIDGRSEDRHPWAIAALVVPLLFCAIVGVGVFLMFHRNMGYFKPAPSGRSAAAAPALAMAPPASQPAIGAAAPPAVPRAPWAIRDSGRA